MAKILLVEDNDAIRQLYERVLMNYHVVGAGDAEKAFQALEYETFDLVILDMHLPSVSGLDILQHLRQFPRHEAVPVFAVSSDETMLLAARKFNIQAWMTKPIDLEALLLAVAECVG